MSDRRGRVPKVLYVLCSTADNPHANATIEVFTSRQKAQRAYRWGDQRLVEFVRRDGEKRALTDRAGSTDASCR